MSDNQATQTTDTVEQSVLKSLRAFVEQTRAPTPPTPKRESTHWSRIVVLVIAAIDISALLLFLDSTIKSPFVDLLLKAIPAVFGVTLAAYVEHAGAFVRGIADQWWFRGLVGLAAFVIVIPQFWTYAVPLDVPDTAQISLDGAPAVLLPVRNDSVRLLPVRGFSPHGLKVQEYDTVAHKWIGDSFTLGRFQLLRSGLREVVFGVSPLGHYRLSASVLSSLTIEHPTTAMLIEVRGVFTELFLRGTALENHVGDPEAGGLRRVSFLKPEHREQSTLKLPPGHYVIRYRALSHCWSDSDTITVLHAVDAAMSLMKVQCRMDPADP